MAIHRTASSAHHYYDDHAPQLFDQYHSVSFERVHGEWLHHLPEQPGLALDVGAGSGRDAKALTERGWQVIAVEPAEQMRVLGLAHTQGSDVNWLNDTLPALSRVRQLSQRFQLILVSAVWMHLVPDDQQRALRVLSSLLAPGGLLVITCREGRSGDERYFQPVNLPALDQWAQNLALLPLHASQNKDQLGREGVAWHLRVFKLPDDGTGALPTLRHIIVNDGKSSSYKLGLLRALTRLADSAPGIVISRTDEWVTVPLGAVGLYWIKLYRPLLLEHQLRQAPGSKAYGFAKDDFYALKYFSPHDLRIGAPFFDPRAAATVMRAIRDASKTILKMPAHYITWPGSQRPIFDGTAQGMRIREQPVRLDSHTLSAFGTFRIPTPLWDCMSRYACWLEPAIVHEWVQLMQRYDADYEIGQLHQALQWQESRRDTQQVRQLVKTRLQDTAPLPCVWSHQDLHRRAYAVDHCFPWARWNNNDLWNLLPATEKANRAKSDRLPAAHVMQQSRQNILHWWDYLDHQQGIQQQFRDEASVALPLATRTSSLDELFESALLQRQRLKANQQLAEWMGIPLLSPT
ncbi:methyltransferase domain-containing protein [Vreelandella rituensis]|uniref:Methyltransferase domain-containing protein n=1 Tax=Vreelandella rituensis TaxID=2282306 RepID=A0A368TWR7_9GAMM|nr:methyltransferase domain-containing protein [Halomonas rituensis]RCV89041.1 methyltransferase domain-containing protein [Halomonas rituensis]